MSKGFMSCPPAPISESSAAATASNQNAGEPEVPVEICQDRCDEIPQTAVVPAIGVDSLPFERPGWSRSKCRWEVASKPPAFLLRAQRTLYSRR